MCMEICIFANMTNRMEIYINICLLSEYYNEWFILDVHLCILAFLIDA